MFTRLLIFSGVIALFFPSVLSANPVSFKGGWGVMPAFGKNWSDLDLNYSLSNREAAGVTHSYREGKESSANFGIVRFNRLLARWNELDSQANIYASLGAGGRDDSESGSAPAGFGSLQADYETRRIYTLIDAETLQSPNDVDFSRFRLRGGVAPYLAPFEEIQPWLVMQVDHMPGMRDETMVTPLLRLFYENYAVEMGVSLEGAPFLAAMAHF